MENKNLEMKLKETNLNLGKPKNQPFDPKYIILEDYSNSMKCRCSCAPTPGPYCPPSRC